MLHVLTCIAYGHDLMLVGFAAIICALACVSSFVLIERARHKTGSAHWVWTAVAAVAAGYGIWATHFISMLAYNIHFANGYDIGLTVVSAAIAVVFSGAGLVAATSEFLPKGRLYLGGVIAGVGISAMHYTGMAAWHVAATRSWDPTYVAASLVLGAALDAAAFRVGLSQVGWRARLAGAGLMLLAIVAMHFTAMSALTLTPDPSIALAPWRGSMSELATELTLSTVLLLAAAIFGGLLDEHLEGRTRAETARLQSLVDDLQKAETRLRASDERYQLAIDGSDQGIWDWRIEGDALFASARAHELLGLDASDPRIEKMADVQALIHPEDYEQSRIAMEAHLRERKPYKIEHRVRMKGGGYRWFSSRAQAIWDENGVPTRMAGSISDIDDLVRVRKDAETANKLKSQFLANMSHEIRTPMNGVLGMCQLLQRTSLDAKQERYAETIMSSAKALLLLINDILDLSKVEAGALSLQIDSVNMQTTVTEALSRVEGIAARRGIELRSAISPDRQGSFEGDQQRIIQILINLLGNALKFTETGSVSLEVAGRANGQTRFSVRDTGPGISEDQLSLIFDRFRQVDGSSTRKHNGTGLGLSICREFVKLMGGEIGVESVVGAGSTFWFDLPLRFDRRTQHHGAASTEHSSDAALSSLRVLVAEDDRVNQVVIREILEVLGTQTAIVENGRLAVEMLESSPFDVVLMDAQMPVMNGDVAIALIRGSGKPYARIPIIALTANAMAGSREQYLSLGADGYVAKPIDISTLRDEIVRVVGASANRAAA